MGFTTVPAALRTAGAAGNRAVGELRAADCGSPASEVAAALPGTEAAGAAKDYAKTWSTAFMTWCGNAEHLAASLVEAAKTYTAKDDHAQDGLSHAVPRGAS